jgi:hypothetical protein
LLVDVAVLASIPAIASRPDGLAIALSALIIALVTSLAVVGRRMATSVTAPKAARPKVGAIVAPEPAPKDPESNWLREG